MLAQSVFRIKKNDTNEIRITKELYKGTPFISIRQWFLDIDGQWRPTRKSISLQPNLAPDIVAALSEISLYTEDTDNEK